MKLLWMVKLYTTGGMNKPYRVKIEGNPSGRLDVPHVFAYGKGADPQIALLEAMREMADSDSNDLLRFVGPQ